MQAGEDGGNPAAIPGHGRQDGKPAGHSLKGQSPRARAVLRATPSDLSYIRHVF